MRANGRDAPIPDVRMAPGRSGDVPGSGFASSADFWRFASEVVLVIVLLTSSGRT